MLFLILFFFATIVFGATAGERIFKQSKSPHFVLQAHAWLQGRTDIDKPKPGSDDWVVLERFTDQSGRTVLGRRTRAKVALEDGRTLDARDAVWVGKAKSSPTQKTTASSRFRLKDGSVAAGRRLPAQVKLASGHTVNASDLRSLGGKKVYRMSFPPFPAVVMLPHALIGGKGAHDTLTIVLFASLTLPLLFFLMRRMREARLLKLGQVDSLILSLAFCFASVFYFAAVQGSVWYAAHVIGTVLLLGYLHCTIGARRPIWAGIFLGCAAITRTPLAFAFLLFFIEARRIHPGSRRDFLITCAKFATPVALIAIAMALYNYGRWNSFVEFGHSYLNVRQQQQMELYGLFDLYYLKRNLKVMFLLTPHFHGYAPILRISGHGMALWLTMPWLLWFLSYPLAAVTRLRRHFPNRRQCHLTKWFAITALVVALPTLFYQNTGWAQFGYRFSLDYLLFLLLILAVTLTRLHWGLRLLIGLGVIINLYGAATFDRSFGQPGDPYAFDTYDSIFLR